MHLSDEILKGGLEGLIRNEALLNLFYQEYENQTGESPCRSCPGKLKGYYTHYKNLNAKHLKSDIMNEFKLKPGSVIPWSTGGGYMDVTQANVNSELKAKNGKSYPIGAHLFAITSNYSKFFDGVPSNLDAMVASIRGGKSEEPKAETFFDELVAIKGIGKKSAQKITEDFESKDALKEAIEAEEELLYSPAVNELLKENFG